MSIRPQVATVIWVVLTGVSALPSATAQTETQPAEERLKLIEGHLKILKSPDNPLEARRIAAGSLMSSTVPAAMDHLLKILADSSDRQAQLAIIEAIAERDDPDPKFIPPLLDLLLNADLKLQKPVATALGRFRDGGLVERLVKIAEDPKNPLVQRLAAVEALGKMSSKETIGALIKLMAMPQPDADTAREFQRGCAASLKDLTRVDYGTNLAAWRRWWDTNKHKSLTQWLEEELTRLASENLALQKRLDATERALSDAIAQLFRVVPKNDAERIATIQGYLKSDLPVLRRGALEVLSGLAATNPELVAKLQPTVRELIADADPGVRSECAKVIRESRDEAALPDLLKQLDQETDPAVKRQVLITLGELGTPELLDQILPQMFVPLDPVALGAVQAVGGIFSDHKVAPALREKTVDALVKRYRETTDPQSELRERLLLNMILIADKKFLPVFTEAIGSGNPDQRIYGARGLAALKDPKQIELLTSHLSDPVQGVRSEVARSIATLSQDSALVDLLLDRLDPSREKDSEVRKAIWQSLVAMTAGWPLDRQLIWTAKVLGRSDQLGDVPEKDLTERLAKRINDQSGNWPADEQVKVFSQFGLLLLKSSQTADAGQYFRRALMASRRQAATPPATVAGKILGEILELGPTAAGPAANALLNGAASVAGLLGPQDLETLTDRVLAALADDEARRAFAAALSNEYVKSVSPEYRVKLGALHQPRGAASRPTTAATKPSSARTK